MLLATREELARADAKATTLFASTGVVFGAVLSGLLSGRWSPPRIDDGPAQVLWWLGAGAAVTALVLLACALFPRTRRDRRHGRITAYYEDVVRLGGPGWSGPSNAGRSRRTGTPSTSCTSCRGSFTASTGSSRSRWAGWGWPACSALPHSCALGSDSVLIARGG